jgi:hypothetical protein
VKKAQRGQDRKKWMSKSSKQNKFLEQKSPTRASPEKVDVQKLEAKQVS